VLRIKLFSLLATLLALAACQTPTPDGLSSILASGELRVGVSGHQPPFNMHSRHGGLMGFDVDLAQALGDAMGLEVRFATMPFAELIPALETRKVDIVISSLTITPERNARVPFAGPYFISGTTVLALHDTLEDVHSPREMNDASRRFAAVAGTTNEAFVRDYLGSAELVSVRDFDSGVALVLDGKVDALLADYPLCRYAAMKHADTGIDLPMSPFTIEPLGVALRADAPMLVNLVQNYLGTLERTGLLDQLKAKWLGDDEWLAEIQ